ncbi:MAG: hypothetical protein R3255_05620 [Candidatus Lokiarchaeia archaeon]|nr:hypothetical protein [Candidatus Lokiarchaeia archaeon]
MVKYYHCEKCKKVYNTETWIGEVHMYNGTCPSCIEEEAQEEQIQQEQDLISSKDHMESPQPMKDAIETNESLNLENEKSLLRNLEQKANEVLSYGGSIDVLIKEIRDGLVEKARKRIEDTIQSFDVSKIEAQKVIEYTEKTVEYLSEYKDFMDNVVKKLQDKPKTKVKTTLEKTFKEAITNMPKHIAKDVLLNKKATLKIVFKKAVKWYNLYSDTEDLNELTKKMFLHPFNEIQNKLSTLPFYTPN